MSAPSLETPPNPVDTPQPAKLRSTRFGELDEHELVRLLDTLDDERSKARFRESIYISVFTWVIIGWFLFYGPRVLFHQPRLVSPFDVLKQREMTNLETPADIARHLKQPRLKVAPKIDQKTLEAMRKAAEAAKLRPAPAPPAAAAAPRPTPAPPPQQQQPLLPEPPRPQQSAPPALASIPDAPKPTPNFGNQTKSASDAIRDAVQGAAKDHGSNGGYSEGVTPSHVGVGTGVDILSDTMGVDFDPYLRKIMRQIYNTWIPLIPEEARPPLNKAGVTQIRFSILPDGRIGSMVLEGSTHDDALNRAAWGSITGVGQFPALPSQFHGPNLELRIHYLVNQKQE